MNSEALEQAAAAAASALPACQPACTVILGSGWSSVTESFETVHTVNYSAIPGLGTNTGVTGHAGQLVLAKQTGRHVLFFRGRRHWYEGAGWDPVAIPVYISLKLGVRAILLTNAAGGLNRDLPRGSLMVIDDHINAMGTNPLIGNTDPAWGPRFADQTSVYDPALRAMLDNAGRIAGIQLAHGIYAATSGPTYETPAETAALRAAGADAVGMSTVPEAMLANAAGIKVAGLSCITNPAAQTGQAPLSHSDVINTAARSQTAISRIIREFLSILAASGATHAEKN